MDFGSKGLTLSLKNYLLLLVVQGPEFLLLLSCSRLYPLPFLSSFIVYYVCHLLVPPLSPVGGAAGD